MEDNTAINQLITLGVNTLAVNSELLDGIQSKSTLNLVTLADWRHNTQRLSVLQLTQLIKGLAIAERKFKWSGGSVSSCRWLFELLLEGRVDIVILDDVTRRVLTNSKNPRSPFGTSKTIGVKDYSDSLKLNGKRKKIQQQIVNEKKINKYKLRKTDMHAQLLERNALN